MPNHAYTYTPNIYFVDNIFKQAWAHYFCTQANGYKYCDLTLIFLLNPIPLFAHSQMDLSIAM